MEIYLQTYGSRLRVKDGIYEVTVPDLSGANQHVKEQIPPHELARIMLQPGTSVSADALLLALEAQTDILILDKYGNPQGRLWSNKPSAAIQTWKKQLAISLSPQAIKFAREWIAEKLRHRLKFLQELKSYRYDDKFALLEKAEKGIAEQLHNLLHVPIGTDTKAATDRIRGHEGTAGRIYYQTLSQLLPKEYQFQGRSKRPAQDLFNAFLNYGLGILYRFVEKALHIAGINPYIGFMHHDGYKDQSMVFDYTVSLTTSAAPVCAVGSLNGASRPGSGACRNRFLPVRYQISNWLICNKISKPNYPPKIVFSLFHSISILFRTSPCTATRLPSFFGRPNRFFSISNSPRSGQPQGLPLHSSFNA